MESMGTMVSKRREIVGIEVEKLVEMLNKALADEWLAYYQYWIGARVVSGPMRGAVAAELDEHAGEELEHAGLLVERIVQLGGTPLLSPQDWYKMSSCGYEAPSDSWVISVVSQNIKGEQCAIGIYNQMLKFIGDKDPVSYNMILGILEDEIEHETDLQTFVEDFEMMKRRGM